MVAGALHTSEDVVVLGKTVVKLCNLVRLERRGQVL